MTQNIREEFEKILGAYNAEILNKYQDEYLMEKGAGCEQVLFPVLEKAKKDFLDIPNDGYVKHTGDVLKDFHNTTLKDIEEEVNILVVETGALLPNDKEEMEHVMYVSDVLQLIHQKLI